jgi:RND family efflux transporter MFP subunit
MQFGRAVYGFRLSAMLRRSASQLFSSRGPLSFAAAFATLAFLFTGCEKREVAPPPGPPDVQVVQVAEQTVPNFQEWVAQLNGSVNADITPKVQGYLLTQNYQNGFFVKKGQLLFELDPRQYEAAVEKAKADVAVAEAGLSEAETNVARDTPLAAQSAIPQKQLDTDINVQAARKAQVQASKAALDNAKLNLSWTKVYSPIDGVAGMANSQIGDLVGTSSKMATVSQVQPIWASFNVSEAQYLASATKIAQIMRSGRTSAPNMPVQYIQANEETYPLTGKIVQINRQVSAGTGTVQLTAEFPNKDAILRPGGFGAVRIRTGESKNALLIPQAAVIEVQGLYQVIVVSPDSKATFRPVKVGERVGTNWIITEGLKPGERVVSEGLLKVQQAAAAAPQLAREGVPVAIKSSPAAVPAEGSN